jgi:hypothetical protein
MSLGNVCIPIVWLSFSKPSPSILPPIPTIVSSGFISDETLLGYLLGALDEQEHAAVGEALQKDRLLRARLNALQSMSAPMLDEEDLYEPPGAMVSRVMSDVRDADLEDSDEVASSSLDDPRHADKQSTHLLSKANRMFDGKYVWMDTVFSLTAAVIGFCLIAPAILRSRETARTSQCAAGLITLGQQIRDFALQNRQARLPEVPTDGPLAFAGVYAIRLNDSELLEEKQKLWCPSSGDERLSVVGVGERRLPSAAELQCLPLERLRTWQRIAGGSYAYNLGVVVNNEHTMPSLDDRSDIAILGDAPLPAIGTKLIFSAHRGMASNVLYQDGRVRLMRLGHGYDGPDHPYLNRRGIIEAGVEQGDSALGASYLSPLGSPLGPVR